MLLSSRSLALLKSNAQQIGGLEKYTRKIQQAFENYGWDVYLLTTGETPSNTVFQTPKGPSFRRIQHFDKSCYQWIQTHRPKVVFGMDRNRFQTHIRAGNGCHKAYLQTRFELEGFSKKFICQINPLHRTVLQIEKESFENPSLKALITNSKMVRNEILNYYNVDPKKIFVIHNGVEHASMQTTFDSWEKIKQDELQAHQLNPSHFHILFIGNGFTRKGLKPLLQAISLLNRKDVFLSVIGKDKRTGQFKKLASSLGIQEQVRFWGIRSDVQKFYAMADALAIPSYYDPFANVTVEAMAMGLFVITSKTNGGHEVIKDQGTIIEDMMDLESICESLKTALSHPKTPASANKIRSSVAHLDFSNQLEKLVQTTIQTS